MDDEENAMSKKILVVDDNKPNRELLKLVLRNLGCEVIEAENGEEGIRKAKETLPDMIFMDIQMPVMNGVTAAKLIRAEPLTAHIPIVAFTSYAMKGDREKLLSQGFRGYIAKPIKIEDIREMILGLRAPA